MTPQEAFDISTRGIISQGGPSQNEKGQCFYRGPNNRKCAAGWLIPDARYSADIEGKTVAAFIGDFDDIFPGEVRYIASDLQDAHDLWLDGDTRPTWQDWKRQLSKIAKKYHLDTAVLDEIPES